MTKKKAIFIDIDGTLLPFGSLCVPPLAVKAVQEARKRGNLVFINTGRCRFEIDSSITDIGFDGIICSNSMYIEENGKALRDVSLCAHLVKRIADWCLENNLGFFFEGQKIVCAHPTFFTQLTELAGQDKVDTMQKQFPVIKSAELSYEEISKVNFIPKMQSMVDKAKEVFGSELQINAWSLLGSDMCMGEMTMPDADKKTGVKFMLERYGIEIKDSYTFGDTMGDYGMIAYAGCGVAMGNAVEELKAVADYVTDDVDKDGLYNAFNKLGLI